LTSNPAEHGKRVYDRAMGLFRSRASKKREKAAAKPLAEQTRAAAVPAEMARQEVIAEARPNPDQPGWGRTLGQAIGKAREDRASQE
jgi:hypothetical protein